MSGITLNCYRRRSSYHLSHHGADVQYEYQFVYKRPIFVLTIILELSLSAIVNIHLKKTFICPRNFGKGKYLSILKHYDKH